MQALHWNDLIIERRVKPRPVEATQFREWMGRQRVFVSSTMDAEMAPSRDGMRGFLERWDAKPIMWETLVPRDQHPERAYLEGVEESSVYVLLLGSRYGVTDPSGYSPTHKEGERAKELGLPRLVFELSSVQPSERDGRLNDWFRSLQSELSTARYDGLEHLRGMMEQRLREMAAEQETPWIKLGNLVFPGRVIRIRQDRRTEFTIEARLRQGPARRAVSELGDWSPSVHRDRLTWAMNTHAVNVAGVTVDTAQTSEDLAEIRCAEASNQGRGTPSWAAMGMRLGRLGPSEQAALWVRQAVFSEPLPEDHRGGFTSMLTPDGPLLSAVLQRYQADGWLSEGLTRLYVVEGLLTRFGGHFEHLEVGPATSGRIRVKIRFVPQAVGAPPVKMEGRVGSVK